MPEKTVLNRYTYILMVKSAILIIILGIFLCSCDIKSESEIADTIKKNIQANSIITQQTISELKEKKIGAVSWRIDYCGQNKLLFHNDKYLIAFAKFQDVSGIYQVRNLEMINSGYMQGEIYTHIDTSPNGNYAIINNANSGPDYLKKASEMYFYDIVNDKLKVISKENHALIKVNWSSNSLYFAFAYEDGSRIKLYDVVKGKIQDIPVDMGKTKSIYVDNTGNVLVDADSKYLLENRRDFSCRKMQISGEIIDFEDNVITYMRDNTVYTVRNGKELELKKISKNYKYKSSKNGTAIFYDDVSTYVFKTRTNDEYKFSCHINGSTVFSPDFKRLLFLDNEGYKIASNDGSVKQMTENIKGNFSTHYYWFDNATLAKITQKNNSYNYGDFEIISINVDTGKEDIIYSP